MKQRTKYLVAILCIALLLTACSRNETPFVSAEEEALQTGVLSFAPENLSCEEVGERLATLDVAVRAGLHCAPLAHRTAQTLERGTIRVSPSVFTSPEQIDRFCTLLGRVIRESARF